jgi:transcriptional regulator with XRE-family HTH domain
LAENPFDKVCVVDLLVDYNLAMKQRMKTENRIRALRKVIGRTQAEFAMMIGASKDAVASWETERNRLSPQFAKRIEFATGVDAGSLLASSGVLKGRDQSGRLAAYTRELFNQQLRTQMGTSDGVNARGHAKNCADALALLFVAAAQPVRGNKGQRLPAVVQSFIQWCEATRKDFRLEKEIDAQLRQRPGELALTHTWGQWRRMQKEDPAMCRAMGFRNDPRKPDGESLTLEIVTVPVWTPGYPMRG